MRLISYASTQAYILPSYDVKDIEREPPEALSKRGESISGAYLGFMAGDLLLIGLQWGFEAEPAARRKDRTF